MEFTLNKKRVSWYDVWRITLLTVVSLIMIFPIFWLVLGSLKSPTEVLDKNVFLPVRLYWENYQVAFETAPFHIYFINSIRMAVFTVAAQILTGSLAGYGFAKIKFKLSGLFFSLFMCSMMIPAEATIISNYLTLSSFRLTNTFFALVAPSLVSMFAVFLFRQFYLTINDALLEAARLDGAGDLRIYASVILPLSKGAMATVGIIGFIGSWNGYLWPMIAVNDGALRTVQTGLRMLMQTDIGQDWGAIMAAASIVTIPVVILFVCLQRYFVQGITKVGIK